MRVAQIAAALVICLAFGYMFCLAPAFYDPTILARQKCVSPVEVQIVEPPSENLDRITDNMTVFALHSGSAGGGSAGGMSARSMDSKVRNREADADLPVVVDATPR